MDKYTQQNKLEEGPIKL